MLLEGGGALGQEHLSGLGTGELGSPYFNHRRQQEQLAGQELGIWGFLDQSQEVVKTSQKKKSN